MNSAYSLKRLLARRARLDAEIAMIESHARHEVVQRIVRMIVDYHIKIEEVYAVLNQGGIVPPPDEVKMPRRVPPKFWNPETGQTWSGRGRLPLWLVGKNIDEYRLKLNDTEETQASGGGPNDAV